MRQIILYIAVSLDGYVADSQSSVNWMKGDGSDPNASGSYTEFYSGIDTVILGWNTYHQIVTELSPKHWPYERCQSYVLTHRELEDQENIHFEKQNLEKLIKELKSQHGKNIWICGGASIVQQLIKLHLIDRFCISVIPTILGNGIRLFPILEKAENLKLIKTESYNGIVDLVYEKR